MRKVCLSTLLVLAVGACSLWSNEAPFPNAPGFSKAKCEPLSIYCFGIETQYFDLIVEGKKTVEGRVNMPDVANLQVGDFVSFKDEINREIICKVTTVSKYPNFTKMLVSEGVTNMLPTIDSDTNSTLEMIVKGDKIYRSFPGYNENVKKYGAIAFGLEYTGTMYKDGPNVMQITDD